MRKSKKTKKQAVNFDVLSQIQPDAAGIDIGAEEIYVCVPPGQVEGHIRPFATFTDDLHRLADWLVNCGVKTVAMESTSIYWIPL